MPVNTQIVATIGVAQTRFNACMGSMQAGVDGITNQYLDAKRQRDIIAATGEADGASMAALDAALADWKAKLVALGVTV